jgi:hypothetical protein
MMNTIACSDIDMYPWNDLQFIGPGEFLEGMRAVL